jgi:parallel beta-helix repeat protein
MYEGQTDILGKIKYIPLLNKTVERITGPIEINYYGPYNVTGLYNNTIGYAPFNLIMNKSESVDVFFDADFLPLPATNLIAIRVGTDVNLTWDSSISADIDHYLVLRNNTLGGWSVIYDSSTELGKEKWTNWTDINGASDWSTYHYKVVAVDASGKNSEDSNIVKCGDWVITTSTILIDRTIQMNGSVIVLNSADLTLQNVKLAFNCTSPGEYGLDFTNGDNLSILDGDEDHLTVDDRSIIAPLNPSIPCYFSVGGSNFTMKNSELSKCGTSSISSPDIILEHNTFNQTGLRLSDSAYNVIFSNSFIGYGISFYGGHNNTISHNNFSNGAGSVIYLADSENNTIEHNDIEGGYIFLSGSYSKDNNINNINISNGSRGLRIDRVGENNVFSSINMDNVNSPVYIYNTNYNFLDDIEIINSSGAAYEVRYCTNISISAGFVNNVGDCYYLVESDNLYLSNMTVENVTAYGIESYWGTKVTVYNVSFKNVGDTGVYLYEINDFYLHDIQIEDCNYGIYVDKWWDSPSVFVELRDCVITNATSDAVYLYTCDEIHAYNCSFEGTNWQINSIVDDKAGIDSIIKLFNCTFNDSKFNLDTENILYVYWYLDLTVMDWAIPPMPAVSADVQVRDVFLNIVLNGQTDLQGQVRDVIALDRVFYSTYNISYNPYTIVATSGTHSGEEQLTVTENQAIIIYLENAYPVASNVVITPSSPNTTSDLNMSYSYFDSDSDSEGSTIIYWYIDGIHNSTYDNLTGIDSSFTSKGQTWVCEVIPHDGVVYGFPVISLPATILNTPPEATNVQIVETSPKSADNLHVTYTFYDIDGDIDTRTLTRWWYNNGSGWTYSGIDNPTLSSENTVKGEQWKCIITPGDGEDYGDPVESPLVTIGNSAPEVSLVIITPESPNSNETLYVSYAYYDLDDDSESGSEIRWYKDGEEQWNLNDSVSVDSSLIQKDESWYYIITPSDGEDFGVSVTSDIITIGNTPPYVTNITISPSDPRTWDELTVTYEFNDNDGDSESLDTTVRWLRWSVNVFFDTGLRGKTLSSVHTSKEEIWTCEVIPHDGFDEGPAIRSDMNVTIINGAPVILAATVIPQNPTADTDLQAYYEYNDPDSDPESGSKIIWYRDDVEQWSLNDSSVVDSSFTLKGEIWHFLIIPSDGETLGKSMISDNITIGNTPPYVLNITISPLNPNTNDNLTVNYQFYDNDGDNESLDTDIKWLRFSGIEFFDTGLRGKTLSYVHTSRGEIWTCEVIPHDGENEGLPTQSVMNVTIGNSPPMILDAQISPTNPTSDSDISALYNFYDPDFDPESGSLIIWYKNDVEQVALQGLFSVDHSLTQKGEKWHYVITPSDGTEFGSPIQSVNITIGNTAPSVSNIIISPANPTAEDDLSVSYDFYDSDGDSESLDTTIKWLRWNGAFYEDTGYRGKILSAAYTSKGEIWKCEVRPHDGLDEGITMVSPNATTITNSRPSASNAYISPDGAQTGSDLQANYDYSDLDGDLETGTEIMWFRDGSHIQELDGQLTVTSSYTAKDQIWNFSVRVFDGTDFGELVDSQSITILNTKPTAVDLTISPNIPRGDVDLVASYNFVDVDSDSEQSYEIRWFRNGLHEAKYNDLLTVNSSGTHKGEFWYFTVKVSDSSLESDTISSYHVQIENSKPLLLNLTPNVGEINLIETDSIEFLVEVEDPDGDWLLIRWRLDKTPVSDSDYYKFETDYKSSGSYELNLTIQDIGENSYTLSYEWTINVADVHLPPQLEVKEPTISNPKMKALDSLKFIIDESDPDVEDTPSVTWYLDGGVAQSGGSSYTYAADDLAAGDHVVKAVVNDGEDSVEYSWNLSVADVAAEELFGMSYDAWGLIMAIISGLAAILLFIFGLYRVRKKKGALKTYMAEIDEISTTKEEDPVEYDYKLSELEDKISSEFKGGHIEDLHFMMLKDIISSRRGEARKAEISQKFDRLPEGVVKNLDEMLKDGKISREEYEGFVATISKTTTLSPYEKKELSQMIGKWESEDGSLPEEPLPPPPEKLKPKKDEEDEIDEIINSLNGE